MAILATPVHPTVRLFFVIILLNRSFRLLFELSNHTDRMRPLRQ